MILSHKHRFIFLKTQKTAGGSLEIALSAICGPDDIITPLTVGEEATRSGRGAQNYMVGEAARKLRTDGIYHAKRGQDYFNHMGAEGLAAKQPEAWASYLKVGFIRNPWDAQVSKFFWRLRGEGDTSPAAFRQELLSKPAIAYRKLFIDDQLAVDFVGKYETLDADYRTLMSRLGVADPAPLPHMKGGVRPPASRDYRTYYDDESRDFVAHQCTAIIKVGGYEF